MKTRQAERERNWYGHHWRKRIDENTEHWESSVNNSIRIIPPSNGDNIWSVMTEDNKSKSFDDEFAEQRAFCEAGRLVRGVKT